MLGSSVIYVNCMLSSYVTALSNLISKTYFSPEIVFLRY
jgi:hypothetical protein